MKHFILFAIIGILLSACLKEDELKREFVSYAPQQMEDGWEVSTPSAEQINSEKLTRIYDDFHADEDLWQVRSLLVFRNGRLIAESYTKDDRDRTTPRAIWSCTKQVVGLLTGIALEKQLIGSIEDPIGDYLPETNGHPDKKDILIRHLLTMRSGISYSNDGLSGQTDDILRQLPDQINGFILEQPLDYQPGEHFQYKDCDPQLVASIIQHQAGKPTGEWAKEVLLDLLEIRNLVWENYRDGVALGGFGILTTPREMAKFGQLVLDKGQWKGNRIVSEEWINEMTTIREEDVYDAQFGYLWWIDREREMVFMSGHGGQYVCIIPSKNLVVVMTAEVNTQGDFQFGRDAFEWVDRVVDAVED
jgi:CubicO group peptidase (beta-lactamase class C family)